MNTQPACIISVYEAASAKIDCFRQILFEENIEWLEEIQEEARKAFGSALISLLPKTPGVKRKRLDSTKPVDNDSPNKHTSTFVDGGKKKKFKIDDMSTIVESSLAYNEVSMLNDTKDANLSRASRSLRPRKKKKSLAMPTKKSKRIAKLSTVNHISMLYSQDFVGETPSPKINSQSVGCSSSNQIVCDSIEQPTIDSSVVISPTNPTFVQPRVAALIEQLKLSTQKTASKDPIHIAKPLDDIKTTLFSDDILEESPIMNKSRSITSNFIPQENCSVTIEHLSITKDMISNSSFSSPISTCIYASSTPSLMPITVCKSTPIITEDVCEHSSPVVLSLTNNSSQEETLLEEQANEEELKNKENVYEKNYSNVKKGNDEVKRDVDSGVSSDENAQPFNEEPEYEKLSKGEMKPVEGRRDTYKVMVREAQLPCKSSPMKIQPFQLIKQDIFIENSPQQVVQQFASPDVFSDKGPKILKHVKGGNIVSGVKSFINRTTTPNKETQEDKRMKRAAELEKREVQRGKALEEAIQRKQKMLELRKRQREDREKRFAEQQARRQEEEDKKRKQMEIKALKLVKNREETKKQREQEDKKKRAVREMKQNDAEGRRLKEDEEHRRKVREQIEDEERRCEMMQRKAEYEEQQRLKKKSENEKAEKERLKQIEEERLLYEERKLREFEEREQHRGEIEKKQKEEREKERSERQQREERLKRAEKEVEEATRKRELEQQRAIVRDEVKSQIKTGLQNKGGFGAKVLIDIQNSTRSSPRIGKDKEMFKVPSSTAPSVKPPAGYSMNNVYNPPVVPLKVRQSTYTTYDIDGLGSDDSTDDESEPTQRVPSWAQGMELKTHLTQQFYANINPEDIFVNCMEPCRLDKIFQKRKERYFRRTSSAQWDSPMVKNRGYR